MANNRRTRLLHIYCCRGAGAKSIGRMVAIDPSLKAVYDMTKEELVAQLGMQRNQAEAFYYDLHQTTIHHFFRENHASFRIVTRFDENYPPLLKEIYDPPWVLFYRGNLALLSHEKPLAVVGTRTPSKHALPTMKKILLPLIQADWCIVSGLAYGIDAMSHRLALSEQGSTISVLGSGLQRIYPPDHARLAERIADKGLLLSEFLPDQPAQKWQFPMRNRLISGLAKGTLVVEARERSGSLITADQALEQGREVFAIPGSVFSPHSKGTNHLIQQGAKMVLSAQDIVNEFY